MKITYLHQYFTTPDRIGGTRSYEMARRMIDAGHKVNMVTSRADERLQGSTWSRECVDGIAVKGASGRQPVPSKATSRSTSEHEPWTAPTPSEAG